MRLICNILWFIFGGGFIAGCLWLLAAALCCITVVGIPFGIACVRIASFAFFPFGKQLVPAEMVGEGRVVGTTLANILWFLCIGLWQAIAYASAGVAYCLTIIGIPFGIAYFKLCGVAIAPLGKRVVKVY